MLRRLTGQCLCGDLVYSVEDAFAYALNCHCSLCRRTTGAAFKPLAGIARDRLELTRGAEDVVLRFGDGPDHNINCRHCGSFLYAVVRDGTYVHVAMGTLTDTPTIRPSMHIFVGSKAPWYEITDDLPQYEAFPPEASDSA
jgi:hypothetical protein